MEETIMAGPWEEFQTNNAPGPWQEFQTPPPPYEPSLLERASEGVQNVGRAVAPTFEKLSQVYRPIPSNGDITTPRGALAESINTAMSPAVHGLGTAMGAVGQGLNRAGEYIAEQGGQVGTPVNRAIAYGLGGPLLGKTQQAQEIAANPYIAGGAGFTAATAPFMLTPTPGLAANTTGRILAPMIPSTRAAAVAAAERLNVPLTRAEMTGSRMTAAGENWLEKTPMGSTPLQEFKTGQMEALQRAKTGLQEQLGTQEEHFDVGRKAQRGQAARTEAMNVKRRQMFENVPEDVNIPLDRSQNMADTIIQEQSQFLPNTRNQDVISLASDVQNAAKAVDEGTPNWPTIQRLRDVLNTRIEANNRGIQSGLPGQANAVARDYQRLKNALDEDINAFGTSAEPMKKGEFAQAYRKANAFSGAYKGLFKSDEALAIAEAQPNRIIDMVFKKNNETDIKQFRAIVGEEGFQSVKRRFTQDILESPNVEAELGKYKPGTLRAIYTQPELNQIRDYAATQNLTKTVGNLQGTSGSARSMVGTAQITGLGAGLATAGNLLATGHPVAAAGTAAASVGQFVAPRYLAKGYLSEFARRGLSAAVRPGVAKLPERAAIYGTLIDRITTKDNQREY
jgi:hypothetical protein